MSYHIDNLFHDLKVGFSIGAAQAIVGHPFDTVKVIWQNKLSFSQVGLTKPLHFYRGFSFPVGLNLCTNMTVFPIYESLKSNSEKYDYYRNCFISGFIAGGLSTPVVYTFDVGKIKKQVHPGFDFRNKLSIFYTTPGFFLTFWRESISTGFYFYTYERFTKYFLTNDDSIHNTITIPFIGGSLAGLAAWTTTFPVDVVRTKQMSFDLNIRRAFYHDTSWKGLWNGYIPCAVRSIFVNGISFVIYHYFSKGEKERKEKEKEK